MKFRLSAELRRQIEEVAAVNKRTFNSEIIARLKASFATVPGKGAVARAAKANLGEGLEERVAKLEDRFAQMQEGERFLREPHRFAIDDRLDEKGQRSLAGVNEAIDFLNEARAVEIAVTEHLAKSKIAWKIMGYQHALIHRMVALIDGAAAAWNARSTLTAMLAARAFMETLALYGEFIRRIDKFYAAKDLASIDKTAQNWTFATRDTQLTAEHPEICAISVLTVLDKFDKHYLPGFRGHYDRLSERCHPNWSGHTFMFAELDHKDGTIRFTDERKVIENAEAILAAVVLLSLVKTLNQKLDTLTIKVADLEYEVNPVWGAKPWA